MLKKIGGGIILWAIPYATAIPLLGLNERDQVFFKTIMIIEGSIVGAVLAAIYFTDVQRDYLREGIVLGTVWIGVNWILDYAGLIVLTEMSLDRYFAEIGLRYIAMAAPTVAIGYVLQRRLATQR